MTRKKRVRRSAASGAMSPEAKLARYPGVFLTIASLAYEKKEIPPIELPDENAAFAIVHRFNRFRHLLVDLRHPAGLAAMDLLVTKKEIAGKWYMTCKPAGIYHEDIGVFAGGKPTPEQEAERAVAEGMMQTERTDDGFIEGWLKEKKEAARRSENVQAPKAT
jgi:hypothetical protein